MLSSSKVLHAIAADAQHTENNILLAGTVASGVATTTNVLTSASTLAHQFSSYAVPGLAIADGVCKWALGLTDMVFAFRYSDEQMELLNITRKELFLKGLWEAVKGTPALYYGLQAWEAGSFSLGCYGLALTNTLGCLGEIISWVRDPKHNPADLIKPLVKGLEAAGWWLLAFGHPVGWACLAAVLMYKLYEGNLLKQLKQDGAAVLASVSTLFSKTSNSTIIKNNNSSSSSSSNNTNQMNNSSSTDNNPLLIEGPDKGTEAPPMQIRNSR